MSNKLRIGILQYDVLWHRVTENLKKAEKLIRSLPGPVDLILLPEMFATGFTMEPYTLPDDVHEDVETWMKEISMKYNAAMAGTHPFPAAGGFHNRLVFFSVADQIGFHYDKRHLFTMGEEDRHYIRGTERKVITFRDWKIMPLICYDLRFPVWSRNDMAYDLLFYSSNWPAGRNDVWEVLLKARAIENQSFVIGINRVGTDGLSVSYIGNSQVISPKGNVIVSLSDEESFLYYELDLKELKEFRKKFPVLNHQDRFKIIV
jgi:predicted amidohydrolase